MQIKEQDNISDAQYMMISPDASLNIEIGQLSQMAV